DDAARHGPGFLAGRAAARQLGGHLARRASRAASTGPRFRRLVRPARVLARRLPAAPLLGRRARPLGLRNCRRHGGGPAGRHDARDLPRFDYSFATPGIFAQDEVTLSSKWTLGASARLDHHSAYGTFASPRLSLLYKPAPEWAARLSAGTGFFAPTPFIEQTE